MDQLLLRRVHIKDVRFGDETTVSSEILSINKEELVVLLLEDRRLKAVTIEIAKPGESKRIIPVKDVIEPRAKIDEKATTFPGFLGSSKKSGTGITAVLDGTAVVTCGRLVNFQEGLIDMSGPGAEFSLFSRNLNVVLVMDPVDGLNKHEHEEAVREAGVRAAHYLGLAAVHVNDYTEEVYPAQIASDKLTRPRVVYVNLVIAQGLLHDNYIYGVNAQGCLPTLLNPTEIMDGAIVSGNCAAPCHKHTTYHQQNNPIIADLMTEHGVSLSFGGVIVSPVMTDLGGKERNCNHVVRLAKMLGAQGAIVSEDGGGNPETDIMLLARLLEKEGIKTVLVTDEYAGRDGASPGLADVTPEADAVVTNGNGNQYVLLPPMESVIGHLEAIETITGGHTGSLRPDGSIAMEIAGILGATVELGAENLTTIAV
jgi:glycine reductase